MSSMPNNTELSRARLANKECAPSGPCPTTRRGAGRLARHCFAMAGVLFAASALATEADVKLAPGPGVEVVQRNCMICHSADYIPMNSPIADRKGWEAEVAKMINAFGAPVPKEDVETIVQYLTRHYSTQSPGAEMRK